MRQRTTSLLLLHCAVTVAACSRCTQAGLSLSGDGSVTPGSDATFSDGGSPNPGSEGGTRDGSSTPSGDGSSDGAADAGPASLDTPAVEAQVATLLGAMTLAQKAGQMVMMEYTELDASGDVATYGLGALLAGGGDAPGTDQPSDWLNLTNQYRAPAMALTIPILFGIDAVHGTAKVEGATVFPHGIGMGCTRDPTLVQGMEYATAAELVAMGINMSFSPDSDVGQDERWGRTYESFGEDPMLVSTMVAAAVTGYQQPNLGAPGTVLACPKHALGAGGTTWGAGVGGGIDQGDNLLTEAQMRAIHLPPFQAAIHAGAMSMMVSYSSWNGTKMSASTEWLTNVIKGPVSTGGLGYTGFLLSDFNAIQQLPGTAQQEEATAINAGLDMIMMSTGYQGFISDIKTLVGAETIAQSRIDDAVTRILRTKVIAGLFGPAPTGRGTLSTVGSAANRQIARKAVQESAVLLQNNNSVLPIAKSKQIFVVGAGDDVGVQSGGWTLGWQGVTNVSVPVSATSIGGTTLLDGLQAATSTTLVQYNYDSPSVAIPAGTDVIVVVLYENPYAEYLGDTDNPDFTNNGTGQNPSGNVIYSPALPMIVSNITSANTTNLPMVLVLLTGRPIRIQSYLSTFDAVVAAWLPGSEGEGLADLLYGDAKFSGKLSKSLPTDTSSLPITSIDGGSASGAEALYAFGFGLTD